MEGYRAVVGGGVREHRPAADVVVAATVTVRRDAIVCVMPQKKVS